MSQLSLECQNYKKTGYEWIQHNKMFTDYIYARSYIQELGRETFKANVIFFYEAAVTIRENWGKASSLPTSERQRYAFSVIEKYIKTIRVHGHPHGKIFEYYLIIENEFKRVLPPVENPHHKEMVILFHNLRKLANDMMSDYVNEFYFLNQYQNNKAAQLAS